MAHLTPETLKLTLQNLEHPIGVADLERLFAHVNQWEKDLNTAERLLVQLRHSYDGLFGIRRTQIRMEIEEFIARREAARLPDNKPSGL